MSVQAIIRWVPVSFWRFGLVGIGGLFVDMAVLYAVIWGLGLGPVLSKVFSFLAAATFTWWMNRRYTFGHSGKALLHEWASFLVTNAFGGAVNFAVYTGLVTQWPSAWMPALATAAGSVSGLMFNYLGSRHIVFKPSRRSAPAYPSMAMTVFCLTSGLAALLAPALWNGFPIMFHDSGGYVYAVMQWAPMPGRSLFYGLYAWATSLGWRFFWGPVLAQSLLTLWLLRLMLRCHGLPAGPQALALVCVGLGLLTGVSWYTSQLLPDIFIPMTVLALWLLGFRWEMLGKVEQAGLAAVALLGLLSHMSCLALALGLLVVSWVAKLVLPRRGWPLQVSIAAPAWVVLASLATMPLVHLALMGKAAYTPGGSMFLYGRLVQDGLAQRWLAEHCPVPGIKLCALQDRMPHTADDFLWGSSPFRDIGGWDGANSELSRLVAECMKAYPGDWAWTSLCATGQQIMKIQTGDGLADYHFHTRWVFSDLLSPSLAQSFNAARQQEEQITPALFEALNTVHAPVAYASMVALLVVVGWGLRVKRHDLAGLALFVWLALLGNAFICGALSNPHDRYQSRLVWLATLVSGMAAFEGRRPRPSQKLG